MAKKEHEYKEDYGFLLRFVAITTLVAIILSLLAVVYSDNVRADTHYSHQYFIDDLVLNKSRLNCMNDVCFYDQDNAIRFNTDNKISEVYSLRQLDSVDDCLSRYAEYRDKVKVLNFFPLYSGKNGFGGIFEKGQKNYKLKVSCVGSLFQAKIIIME